MKPKSSKRNRKYYLLFVAVLLPTGCSDLTAKVNGTVYLDDKPVKITSSQRGTVMFRPVAGGATCTGLIGESGRYSVSTGSASKLAPGEYLVSVQVLESIPPKGGDDAPTGKPITPALYADPLTSGLSLEVKNGKNQYDIKLDSLAGPAVLPPQDPEETPEEQPTGSEVVTPEEAESEPKSEETVETESVEAADSETESVESEPKPAAADKAESAETAEPAGEGNAS